jgi:spermidine/putrescine transport system permease protein
MNRLHDKLVGWPAWLPLAYLTVLCLLPTGLILGYSLLRRDFYGQVLQEFSLDGWRQVLSSGSLRILVRTLVLAMGVTATCLLVSFPCALTLAKTRDGVRQFVILLIVFPLATSLLLRVYGWMNLLPSSWRGTPWAVGFVMVVNYLPFMLLPLLRAIERMDRDLESAAMDLGATPWQAFWLVIWPVTRPGAWAGCALVFIPAVGEYMAPHFIGAGKCSVLGTLIAQQFMERRNWPFASAAAMLLLGLILVPATVFFLNPERVAAWIRAGRKEADVG